MNEFEDKLRIREEEVDGKSPWLWLAVDTGAWDGPKVDLENHHLPRYKEYTEDRGRAVAVQAGGNQGMYPRVLSDVFERVYTFEPCTFNFHCLVNNCQRENVFKFNAALGSSCGIVSLKRGAVTNTGTHTIDDKCKGGIPMLTIDSLNLDACDLITLDIEGYEVEAIKGALETIKKYRPVISTERGNDSIYNILKPLGYSQGPAEKADSFYIPPNTC